jgi:hypothetical protein
MAIQFLPTQSYPQNNEDEFPVGQEIVLVFSEATDIKRIKESFVVYGEDFDRTSGPNNALWLNNQSGENPFFLRSPGFKGFLDCDVKQLLVDSHKTLNVLDDQIQLDKNETGIVVVVVTPKTVLKENSKYQTFLVGKNVDNLSSLPEPIASLSKDRALRPRTIFDAYSLNANQEEVAEFERVRTYGSFIPKNNEDSSIANIKIITAGEGSSAKYKWWFSDEVEPQPASANYKERVSRCVQRWRKLDRGLLVKFSGDSYLENEEFKVRCYSRADETLTTSYSVVFQTGTGAIYEYPENTSTSPIGVGNLLLPEAIPGAAENEALRIVSVTPGDGSVNNELDLKQIVIEFNKNLDATTINQSSVEIISYPVSGTFDGNAGTRSDRERKVYKIISVEANRIILEL